MGWLGATVNMFVVRTAGTAVMCIRHPGMLASVGGPVVLTKDWARYPLQQMGYKRLQQRQKTM